jgi:hypothetical protein
MQEIVGDLFASERADAICITTNGVLNSSGANVMGLGCAAKAKERWPGVELILGQRIQQGGNRVHLLTQEPQDGLAITPAFEILRAVLLPTKRVIHYLPYHLVSFPTKNHWRDPSDPQLIATSAHQLVELVDEKKWKNVILPRPGCGLGKLAWEEVRSILSEILDDRFWVISFQ